MLRFRQLITLLVGSLLALLWLPLGTAHAAASMTVWDFTGTVIGPGGTFAMGTTTVGVPFQHYFVVAPAAPDPLENVAVSVPAGFQLIVAPPSTIQPGAAHGVTVRCLAQDVGLHSGNVVITSNAANSPYTFTITCTVDPQPNTPDIALKDYFLADIPPGGTLALGSTDPNVTKPASVRVFNNGTGPLLLSPVQYTHPTFTTTGYVPDTVGAANGYYVYFNVRCRSATPGFYTATATVPSNDPDTPSYSFTVTCTVNGAVDPPQDPVDDPVDPVDDPQDPVDDPVEPVDDPQDPADDPQDPVDDPQDPGQPGGGTDDSSGLPVPESDRSGAPEPALPHTGVTGWLAALATALVGLGLVARTVARRMA